MLAAQAAPPVRQSSFVGPFPTFSPFIDGASAELVRWDDRIQVHFSTTGSDAGAPYTLWWVVFNDPSGCIDGCDGTDFNAGLGEPGQIFATGHVVSQSGKSNFTAVLQEGDMSGVRIGQALTDAMGAEIHVITRSHTDQTPGLVDDAIHSFGGGCSAATPCANKHMAKFLAP